MTIAIVRALVPDLPQYDQIEWTGDGSTSVYSLPNRPADSTSVVVYVAGVIKATRADYSVNAALGLVTFVVAPALAAQVVVSYQHTLLSDDTLTTYLTLEGDDRLAAADALDAIASNHALVEKAQRLGELQTSGYLTAGDLREHAKQLRAQAASRGQGIRVRRLSRPQLINGGTEYTS